MRAPRIGVDLGGTKILAVAVDPTTGAVLASRREPTPRGSAEIVETIQSVWEQLVAMVGHRPDTIGIGAAGLVDRGGVLRFGPNLPAVVDLDLAAVLGPRIGASVLVDNDVTCSAVAEVHVGAAAGVSDAVVVALGTGIGGALVLDGRIRRGAHHMAGELGHLTVDPHGRPCGCGRRGCWEQYASGSALARLGVDHGYGGGEQLLAAAATGEEPEALAAVSEFAEWVAVGLAGLVNVCDPELIVLGGGLVAAGDVVLDPIRAQLASRPVGAAHRPSVGVVAATAGPASAAVGAALLECDLGAG